MQSALVFIHSCAQCCLITAGGPAHSWQQLPNSTGEVLTSSFLLLTVLQHWWKFSGLFLIVSPTVCSTISNQLWTFKLNYFPQKEHVIPHMSTLLLLGTITFTIYESSSVSRQCLILVETRLKTWLFLEQAGSRRFPQQGPRQHGSSYCTADWAALVLTLEILHWGEGATLEYPLLSLKDVITSSQME